MIQARRTFAAAALTGFGLLLAGLTMAPSEGSARAVDSHSAVASGRIAVAFAAAAEAVADPSLLVAVGRAQKGDLPVGPACTGEKWPDISPRCLVLADGAAVPAVRSVTLGYQAGQATTVLMRAPAPQVASR